MKIAILFCIFLFGICSSMVDEDYDYADVFEVNIPTESSITTDIPIIVSFMSDVELQSSTPAPTPAANSDSICECGVFEGELSNQHGTPILNCGFPNIGCGPEQTKQCNQICGGLGADTENIGPLALCNRIGNFDHLTASLYSRSCHQEPWNYTGFTITPHICCRNHFVVRCGQPETDVPEM